MECFISVSASAKFRTLLSLRVFRGSRGGARADVALRRRTLCHGRPMGRRAGGHAGGNATPAPHLGVSVLPPQAKTELMPDRLGGDAAVLVIKGFLSEDDIAVLHRLGPTGARKEHDRYEGLEFSHDVWRFEKSLKAEDPLLRRKVLGAMLYADRELWRSIPTTDDKQSQLLHEEVEYIVYDADACRERGLAPPHIGPHVDNSSAVTMVAMLSEPGADFDGGTNLFEDGLGGKIGDGRHRAVQPRRGDALLFRGERCEHSLTEVTRGVRRILQIELCRKREGYH